MAEEQAYDEMRADREREWSTAQAKASQALQETHARLAEMPDVKHAPTPDLLWSHEAIVCPCGGATFLVPRWVTINGHRHRAELKCQACHRVGTWAWTESRWIG